MFLTSHTGAKPSINVMYVCMGEKSNVTFLSLGKKCSMLSTFFGGKLGVLFTSRNSLFTNTIHNINFQHDTKSWIYLLTDRLLSTAGFTAMRQRGAARTIPEKRPASLKERNCSDSVHFKNPVFCISVRFFPPKRMGEFLKCVCISLQATQSYHHAIPPYIWKPASTVVTLINKNWNRINKSTLNEVLR